MIAADIVRTFNKLFVDGYNTVLCGGADEPLYRSAFIGQAEHQIWFRNDYASSALHEIAHWCIAGRDRRLQDDYGYWYNEKRNATHQRRFEEAEARPQGLEWILSIAAGVEFRVSCDNFELINLDLEPLRKRVREEALKFIHSGIPQRAEKLQRCFVEVSGVQDVMSPHHFEELPL
jgi:elongation factor P hydroxylase